MNDLPFHVGIGTGSVTVIRDEADECDGPAFWNAREALEETKRRRRMKISADLKTDESGDPAEINEAVISILFLAILEKMTRTQVHYCYHFLWEGKSVSETAETMGTSKGNASRILSKTPCHILRRLVSFARGARERRTPQEHH